ncbi:MAG: glycosyltransferase [Alphaproteobacteria bacterium]|nr:glycosyltransferase [Alphaproteobacteria bacterium]
MADIVMTDDGIAFDGMSLERGPLGGAETAFISLATALAKRGHKVSVRNKCSALVEIDGVCWAPLEEGVPETCDLYIANRSDKLLLLARYARQSVFWIHNPAQYLLKFRYLSKLWRRRPPIIFSGIYHANSYPNWAPDGGREIIPYGISEEFRSVEPQKNVPPPRAIFTSSPQRGLSWLLDVWRERIHRNLPTAELHVYSGAATYGSHGASRAAQIQPILEKASALQSSNVFLHEPVPKRELVDVLSQSRLLLYQGDPEETFCLAVGEAQAAGIPAVVQDIGCVAERIEHGLTGYVENNDSDFADAALTLLQDDTLWQKQNVAALKTQRQWSWDDAAASFESLIP